MIITLVASTRTLGNGEIANSNRSFKKQVQQYKPLSKGDRALTELKKLFNS